MTERHITLPLTAETAASLTAGDRVLLTGTVYTARDEAHMLLIGLLDRGEPLPFDPKDACIYYTGPCPAPPGAVIGPVGPTTAGRMDPWTPRLLAAGVRCLIGKGARSPAVRQTLRDWGAVYLAAAGGAGALLSRRVKDACVLAFPSLGAEAVYRLEVESLPCTVINDCRGGDLYEQGRARYAQES